MSSVRELPPWLTERLRTAPRSPGVYLMKDAAGAIVYVGKARDLKARLGQYFAPNPGDTRFFVGLLDHVLGAIDVIALSSDKEALLLENELIKQHQPRFNVKLKDDKNFLNIRIGGEHPYPRLEVVRRPKRDGADYFGPYDSATKIRNALRVVNRHFQLRTCSDSAFRNRSRPCLEHQIGRCPAPCVLSVDAGEYADSVQDVKLFLQGRSRQLHARLKAKMQSAAERLEFELAARYRDQIAALERSLEPQTVRLRSEKDLDVLGLCREGTDLVVEVLGIRSGVIRSARGYPMKDNELEDEELIEDFLAAYYDGTRPIPDFVLTPLPLVDADTWAELLSEERGRRVAVKHPQRGEKRRLLDIANENARGTFRARQADEQDASRVLEGLRKRLGLAAAPRRIECYDISNIQGSDPVGSRVVAIDAELAKNEYRRYRIRSLTAPNDFEMMYEVLSRRFKPDRTERALPDLLLIDGGRAQLNIAVEVLRELKLDGVEVAGLAKARLEAPEAGPSSADPSHSPERVFRPGRMNPIVMRPNAPELTLLQRLRDEAHRFAISFHRRLRGKRTLTSQLDDIPGVGPARRRKLLEHFGSVSGVKAASIDDLEACPGIPRPLAKRIYDALRGRPREEMQ